MRISGSDSIFAGWGLPAAWPEFNPKPLSPKWGRDIAGPHQLEPQALALKPWKRLRSQTQSALRSVWHYPASTTFLSASSMFTTATRRCPFSALSPLRALIPFPCYYVEPSQARFWQPGSERVATTIAIGSTGASECLVR